MITLIFHVLCVKQVSYRNVVFRRMHSWGESNVRVLHNVWLKVLFRGCISVTYADGFLVKRFLVGDTYTVNMKAFKSL